MKLMIAITGHWIDHDFRLHEALLTFQELTGSHTGENLASVIFDTLDDYNIAEKLHCITTDNASNNTKAMETLSNMLRRRKGIKWSHTTHHIACLNHVINLVVQAFLRKCKVIDAKSVLSYVNDTAYRAQQLARLEDRDQNDEDQLSEDDIANEVDNDDEDWEEEENDRVGGEEAEQGFKFVIWKLRELFKVCSVAYILSVPVCGWLKCTLPESDQANC